MHRLLRLLSHGAVAALAVALLVLPSSAQAVVTIKLATLAPEGSTWHKALQKIAEEWSTSTGGAVELKIYAGGVAGNETVMLRKMRIGQLHSGAITNIGLLEIDPSSQALNTPMLIRNYDELDYVMETMRPVFEKRIEDKGYVVLNWSDAGWARLFSATPLIDPADRGKLKIFAWEGDPDAVQMYQDAGFKPVVVAATDVVPSLQTGLIDAYPSTPLGALAFQWFALTPNMLDVPWAPLLGATIITKEAWETIPAANRPGLLAIAQRIGSETKAQIRKQDVKAVEVMKGYGLKVNTVDPATYAKWEAIAASTHPTMRDKVVGSPEIFDQVKRLAEEYRAAHP